jgi:hypothetical protein
VTLADLARDVYRRLDYADNPPPSVATRIEGFINTQYVRLLSTDRMRPLRESSVPLTIAASQSEYTLGGTTVARVQRITDLSNHFELDTKPLEWYRRVNPGGHIQGTPGVWVPKTTGYRSYTFILHPTPSGPLDYSVDIERPVLPMKASDTPELLPEDFHDLLSLLARCDEYEFKSDDRWAATKLQADRRVMELRAWVDNHQPYRRTAIPDYPLRAWDDPERGIGASPGGSGSGGGPHNILSPTHPDTTPGTLVGGDLLYVKTGGLLDRLPIGAPGQVLAVSFGSPGWQTPVGGGGVEVADHVSGPADSEVQQIPVFADLTGKIVKKSGAYVSDLGDISLNNRLEFGGVPATSPALVRNADTLEAKLKDDSAYAQFRAKSLVTDDGVYEHGRTVPMGEWIVAPFDPANFTAYGAMNWIVSSGDQAQFVYTLIGKTMVMSFTIGPTTLTGTPSTLLYIKIPGGYLGAYSLLTMATYVRDLDRSILRPAYAVTSPAGDRVGIARADELPYDLGTNHLWVYGTMTFPVQ